jgi:hypothetical protein
MSFENFYKSLAAGGYTRGTLLNDIIECEWWAMVDAALSEASDTPVNTSLEK